MTSSIPRLELDQVTRRFGDVVALDDVSLQIGAGQIACLVGHSGCGKSTLLRAIAGVDVIDGGSISLDGKRVCGDGVFIEPEHRRVGFMFQDYALFPHLTARQNIAFGLSRLPRDARKVRTEEIIMRIGIERLADRHPHMLSGGEQQRVALARALAPEPDVLLMDEPFSNLDRGLREAVRNETLTLIRALGATAIIVTHDPEEALAVGDMVALMQQGRLIEAGSGETIYNAPRTAYAAAFFSRINKVPARRAGDSVETPFGQFPAPGGEADLFELYIRPHALRLGKGGVAARVLQRTVLGEIEELTFAVDGLDRPLVMRSSERHEVQQGQGVFLSVDPAQVMIFAPDRAA